nr:hypothetical protein Q903MT_gene964 [Picea sitchensis]
MNGNGFLTCMNELGMNRSGSRKGVTPGGYSWFKKTYIYPYRCGCERVYRVLPKQRQAETGPQRQAMNGNGFLNASLWFPLRGCERVRQDC